MLFELRYRTYVTVYNFAKNIDMMIKVTFRSFTSRNIMRFWCILKRENTETSKQQHYENGKKV